MAWRVAIVALLAGCTGVGSDAVTAEVEGTTLRLALLDGERTIEIGRQSVWTFGLKNIDNRSVELARGCGQEWEGPWVEDDAGGRIHYQPQYATCAGFRHESLEPGEEWTTQLRWDGSIYEGQDEQPVGEVDPGIYHIRLRAPWEEPLDLDVAIRVV